MKPSFALDFRDGLVTLLHRTSRGWSQVGSTAFDAPDFVEALGYMRSTALGLSPRGITTKLIIPNDQILYTTIHAPGPDAAKRKRQIKAGLEGRTPYAVEDLVYDWWGTGPDLNVAVIAKETLAEAEGFAAEHRFNPVSFVGVADNGIFLGEPFFGPSALAATLLTEGEKVERDSDPVTIIARDFPRSDARAKAAEPVVEAAVPPVEVETHGPASGTADVVVESPVKVPAEEPVAEPEPPPREPEVIETVSPVADPVATPEPVPESAIAMPAVEPAAAKPTVEVVQAPPPAQRQNRPQPPRTVLPEVVEAPMAIDVAADAPQAAEDDVPPSPAAEVVAAFANRRSAAIAAATAGSAKQAGAAAPKVPAVGPAPAQRPTVPRPNMARPSPAGAAPSAMRDTVPFPAKANGAAVKAPAGKPAKPGGASVTAAGILGARRERNVVSLPTASTPEEQAAAAARRAAVKPPTGLGSRSAPIKGKPRYLGLMLTVLLLVLLIAVAAWSSFFMGANDTTGTGAGTATTPSPTASATVATPATTVATGTADATPDAAVVPETQAAATQSSTADAPATAAVPQTPAGTTSTQVSTSSTTGSANLTSQADAAAIAAKPTTATTADVKAAALPVAEPAPKTEVSTVGLPAVLPVTSGQDKIVLAMADTPPKPVGPLALPALAAGADASPAAEPPPPPYGTVYKFDADGRIIPTPDGILTPEGVLLIAGKPKLTPPERPAEVAPVVPDAATAAAQPTTQTAPATDLTPGATTGTAATTVPTTPALVAPTAETAPAALVQDPTLAGKHPKERPTDLAPVPDQQGAVAATPEDSRLASLHPAARPKDLPSPLAPDTGADATAASASLAANGFALATSLKPVARPSGLDQAVDTAVAAALKEPAPDAQVASNDPAPEAQEEPDTEAPAPDLPTNASVAKQATTKHALNTNKLALLAVFGTPSTRFAMIRQGNGAVKKIKIGDTIDGGRVAAITANSVQYQKGGRIVTLSLPTG